MTDLELVQSELARLIGTPASQWDTATAMDVDACIRRGIHNVIHNGTHQWTWMRPVLRFSTAADQRRYTLPLDFEHVIDDISFDGSNYQYPPICQKPASRLLQLQSEYVNTGTPTYYALEHSAHDGQAAQQQQLVLHPTPDAEYPLVCIYQVGPIRALDSSRPYFPGGPSNLELFLQSCLAAAESKFCDTQAEKHASFQATMNSAIAEDLRRQPRNMGPLRGQRQHRGNLRDALGWKLGTTYLGARDL